MYYDQGCFGRVDLGPLPQEVTDRLSRIPGEWLEFDPPTGAIVVRHVEPSTSHHLPAVACELVRLFSEIPAEHHEGIPGGAFFVHTEEEKGQLIRLRVEPGGAIHIRWAHPDFKRATRKPWGGGAEIRIDPEIQKLDGTVTLRAANAAEAAGRIRDLADNFEGLYPEGDCLVRAVGEDSVELTMEEVNLDAAGLVALLQELAAPGSLSGRFRVGSFGTILPEHQLRILFEAGEIWVQHPLLWPEASH
jgi:hypothetical protein